MTAKRTAFLITASAVGLMALAACGNNNQKNTTHKAEDPATMAPAQATPIPGQMSMNVADNIVANASRAANLTTLVSAIQTAGLASTLQGPGPFTVFAPDNAAFDKIPAATRDGWMQPAQKTALSRLLTYHVVPGRVTAADLASQAQANNGTATLTTVQGEKLSVRDTGGGKWQITDAKGGTSNITQADLGQSNGMIHIIDTVLMPK